MPSFLAKGVPWTVFNRALTAVAGFLSGDFWQINDDDNDEIQLTVYNRSTGR